MNQVAKAKHASRQILPVERIKDLSPVLRGQYPASRSEADQAKAIVQKYEVAADPRWVAQRVVKFLAGHYFVVEMADQVAEQLGVDWVRELQGLPDWAIEAAFAWWISRHNPKREKKPLPGDISARALIEAAPMEVAKTQIRLFARHGNNPPGFVRARSNGNTHV